MTSLIRIKLVVFLISLTAGGLARPKTVIFEPSLKISKWQHIKFDGVESNIFENEKDSLKIKVRKSASFLCISPARKFALKTLQLKGHLSAKINVAKSGLQGDEDNDDFFLRMVVISKGENTMSGIQKMFAKDWIKELYKLAGSGIGEILFLNAANLPTTKYQDRRNSSFEQLREKVEWTVENVGDFDLQTTVAGSSACSGLCFFSDGDQTQSEFDVVIKSLRVTGEVL